MLVQVTTAGVAALDAAGGVPMPMGNGILGSGVNYIPSPSQTAIQGTEVASQVPLGPQTVNPNVVRYSIFLDINAGTYQFGEVGLFLPNGTLFAIGVATELITKIPVGVGAGNTISIDIYVSSVSGTYAAWLEVADSTNFTNIPKLGSVDLLPGSTQAIPNLYVIMPPTSNQSPFQAYSDQQSLWSFDKYDLSTTIQNQYTVTAATNTSVTISNSQYNSNLVPAFVGDKVLQFNSGPAYGYCRNMQTVIEGSSTTTISFASMATPANVGDTFLVYSLNHLSVQNIEVPVATTSTLGVVQIGAGLDVTAPSPGTGVAGGVISVDRTTVPSGIVWSLATKQGTKLQGDIPALNANQLIGSVLTVNGQGPDTNGNVTVSVSYNPPVATATTLGVVMGDPAGNITIASSGALGLGFTPIKSVNNQFPDTSGNATIVGLVNPTALSNAQDLNTVSVAGLYFAATDAIAASLQNGPSTVSKVAGTLEVVPLTAAGASGSDVIQRWMQHGYISERRLASGTWSAWIDITPNLANYLQTEGSWNALTNSATVGTATHVLLNGGQVQITVGANVTTVSGNGYTYRVSAANNPYTASPLTLDGITTFVPGDLVVGFGSTWTRVMGNTIIVT